MNSQKHTKKILIIYYHDQEKRTTILDHLYSFARYADARCYYINLAYYFIPSYINKIDFDLIIFHTIFLSLRWDKDLFRRSFLWVKYLKNHSAIKIALPQDEFINTNILCEFINEFNVNYIFSVAPESEWHKIYNTVNREQVKIHRVLTGYLESKTLQKIESMRKSCSNKRNIDIGYRAWRAEYWLGRHGFLKTKVAEIFKEKAAKYGFLIDISTRNEDTFYGDDWYKFLISCKYTIGVEGGASILDCDGKIREKTNSYLTKYPNATFEEVESECFPYLDGNLNFFAISPRHLEACATKTCQILVESEYNGILIPNVHYIEIKRDFSNIEEVLALIKTDNLRKRIVESAYQDIVISDEYSYKNFVTLILYTIKTGQSEYKNSNVYKEVLFDILYFWFRLLDLISWRIANIKFFVKHNAPQQIVLELKKVKRKLRGN